MKPVGIIAFFLFLLIAACSQSDRHAYQGYVEAENIYLASPYSGILKKMCAQRGQTVKKGQLLFQLDENPQNIAVLEARSVMEQQKYLLEDARLPKRKPEIEEAEWQVAQVEAQVRLALLRVKRYEELVKKHASDKDSLDAAKEHYEELLAVLNQKKDHVQIAKLGARDHQVLALNQGVNVAGFKIGQLQWQVDQKKLYAPADGIVFDTYFRRGEFVAADRPVASILDPKNIRIDFFVPVKQMATLKIGEQIAFRCDGCKKIGKAIISYISPEAEYIPPLVYSRENSDKLVFRVKAIPDEPLSLKPGQPVVITGFSHES